MPAQTLEEAAYKWFNVLHTPWDAKLSTATTEDLYVQPPGQALLPQLGPSAPPAQTITRRLLAANSNDKILVSGQLGAGKSTALWRVASDPKIKANYDVVLVQATANLGEGLADLRLLLLVIANAVATRLDALRETRPDLFSSEKISGMSSGLQTWLGLLGKAKTSTPTAPSRFAAVSASVKARLVEITTQIRSDSERRKAILADTTAYSARQLSEVVSTLLTMLDYALAQDQTFSRTLLVLDDVDKYRTPTETRSIFLEGGRVLADLPCAALITHPYWLSFEPEYAAALSIGERIVVTNVKTFDREDKTRRLTHAAQTFFREMFRRLADAKLVRDLAVVDRAAVLSAGIPREFVRILAKAFELCMDYSKDALDQTTLEAAKDVLRQQLERQTTLPADRARLKLVRETNEIRGFSKQLEALHIVEFVNNGVWYAVNPLLETVVDSWIDTDRQRLGAAGATEPELGQRLLDEWKRDADGVD